ncbi:MAG: gamma-butyrobetaine hydroxylase-like domain-containing protein [Pseudomonadota bacterium]
MIDTYSIDEDARALCIDWTGGERTILKASLLRREARDATSLRERIDHGQVRVADGLCITGVFPVGSYGVNVHFSDGHDRAIYPFVFLRELSEVECQ